MKLEIDGCDLKINLPDLVRALDKETRAELARFLVADRYLFHAVLECVGEGDGSYFTDDDTGEWWFDRRTVLHLREALMPLLPLVARGIVEQALRERNIAQADEQRMSKWAFEIYQAWPRDRLDERPSLPIPNVNPAPVTVDEVDVRMQPAKGAAE